MRDLIVHLRSHGRDVAFAACALCTLWLIVQNTVLFALLPWERTPAALQVAARVTTALFAAAVPLALIAGTLAMGWFASRPGRVGAREKMRHE